MTTPTNPTIDVEAVGRGRWVAARLTDAAFAIADYIDEPARGAALDAVWAARDRKLSESLALASGGALQIALVFNTEDRSASCAMPEALADCDDDEPFPAGVPLTPVLLDANDTFGGDVCCTCLGEWAPRIHGLFHRFDDEPASYAPVPDGTRVDPFRPRSVEEQARKFHEKQDRVLQAMEDDDLDVVTSETLDHFERLLTAASL